ncbi:hypothetical protein OsJ_07502 [Oryza sativa Japonica Group]|uniref:Nuclear cap-binding protein subunit 2 n=1 Tax=Oryza sativa subsp. japonica TaxID=39947 RepID=B9F118_ORYSJ|nr:hypothetical protein OsJ_07502 [Oryza sativa Japonica Group]
MLDDRPIRVDFDWGFEEGRQWGRGRSGGQMTEVTGREDYQRKRYRNDERSSQRAPDSEFKRDAIDSEKNPRFREKGDSDEEDDDYDKRRRR